MDDWVAAMNAKALQIGMTDSHFGTPNGWMDDGRTFVTARDLGLLGRAMVARHPSKYRHFVGARELEYNGIRQANHDPISGVIPGADGIKTGFTNQAGYGFLGSAERDGRRLIMVVAGSPRGSDRNAASRAFIEWGFQNFRGEMLFGKSERIGSARVQGGGVPAIGLVASGPVMVALSKGTQRRDIALSIRYEGPLQAPIAKGEEVAELIVEIDGMPDHRVPLLAKEDVLEATYVQRVFNAFRGWVT